MTDSSLTRKALTAVMATIAAVALSACGTSAGEGEVVDLGTGNAGSTTAPGSGGSGEEQAAVVPVAAFEYGYQLIAPVAAGAYTFELTNDGTMQHDLVIEGEGLREATAIINSGETDSFTVELEPGTYTLYCSVGTHRSQGMELTFSVA